MAAITSKTNVLHLLAASSSPTALDAVQNLLKTGQKHVDELEEEGLTALHVAAAWDNLAMCQLLMFFGAEPFQKDDHGRTAIDMAKGTVRKFFERLYDTKSSSGSRKVNQPFMRALRRLFSCTSPMRAIKSLSQPKRPHSWSPPYDGRDSFLSEEEKQLRWAFRKNQPIMSKKDDVKPFSLPGKKLLEEKVVSPVLNPLSPITSIAQNNSTLYNVDSNSDANYVTARECNTDEKHWTYDNRVHTNNSPETLSRKLASLKMDPVQLCSKDWMTDESSDKSVGQTIPADILRSVRQMSDQKLKRELAKRGVCVGPLTVSTRPAYDLKLARLIANMATNAPKLKYSWALESWIAGRSFPEASKLNEIIINSFAGFSDENCREGNRPTSFCYILIDPSFICVSSNSCTMQQFVDSIFYIGKGKRSRPLQHLVDAVRAKDFGDSVLLKSKKLQRIVNLWANGHGVVSLHVFQNTIPVEAFTREAAMIDAIGIENLTNAKRGDYYGVAKNWTTKERTIFGSFLLSNALAVFHVEGCREIYENDIQGR